MTYAKFSIYSQDARELGYKPFEYWKGPKPVPWSYYKSKAASTGRVSSVPFSKAYSLGPAGCSNPRAEHATLTGTERWVAQVLPLQPDYLHVAQQRIAPSQRPDDSKSGSNQVAAAPGGVEGDIRDPSRADGSSKKRHTSYGARPAPAPSTIGFNKPARRASVAAMGPSNELRGGLGRSPWNVRQWGKRTWGVVSGLVVIIIIIAVVAVVESNKAKANRYPDYTKLDYTLSDTYSGTSFFDHFEYWNTYDPTNGFVHYVDADYAASYNLTHATASSAVVKVDTTVGPDTVPDASTGRFSVRLHSKKQYETGLFVFDVKHTPYGCATWPALWMTDENNWPQNGEIDVMEATNNASNGNMMTLHTSPGCDMSVKRLMTAEAMQADCQNGTNKNTGCNTMGAPSSYGQAFNAAGGGLMAVELRTAGIRMWQWNRSSVPLDVTQKNPDPSSWGIPLADFPSTNCDISSHFKNQSIIINIDLCGDLVEPYWNATGCSPKTCSEYVANNPSMFVNAYWEFGPFWVYQTPA